MRHVRRNDVDDFGSLPTGMHDFCGHGVKHGIPSSSLQSRPSMQLRLTEFAIAAMLLMNFIDDDENWDPS